MTANATGPDEVGQLGRIQPLSRRRRTPERGGSGESARADVIAASCEASAMSPTLFEELNSLVSTPRWGNLMYRGGLRNVVPALARSASHLGMARKSAMRLPPRRSERQLVMT